MRKRVLIVGGVAGGASCAARLRRLDEAAEIVMFDRGPHVSLANCGLPNFVGDVITDERKLLIATRKRGTEVSSREGRRARGTRERQIPLLCALLPCGGFLPVWRSAL